MSKIQDHALKLTHDSATGHVSGRAAYTDDVKTAKDCLHAAFVLASEGPGEITDIDINTALSMNGVHAVFTAEDIPGENNAGPVIHDEPLLAQNTIAFPGQAVAFIVADSRTNARRAARKITIGIKTRDGIYTIDQAMQADSFLHAPLVFQTGEAAQEIASAPYQLSGNVTIGGQDHLYLEGQVALATPSDDGVHILSSTQHPSEIQDLMAACLDWPAAKITVEVRRMGGAFGGKESQAAQMAVMAGLAAVKLDRPVKIRLDRNDDMIMTGKRHDFKTWYNAGFDDNGRILGIEQTLASRCGYGHDLSRAINDRAMFHADNAYYLPALKFISHRCKTDTVSNTAFRGFGGPQGMVGIERIIDKIAARLDKDPLDIRLENLYGSHGNTTPYGMDVTDNVLGELIPKLAETSDYRQRRADIIAFNANSKSIRRGIALTPVKFGISFTSSHLNQAGALVHIYKDGSVHLNHGGTEMGQGLYTKVASVVMRELGIGDNAIQITSTRTDKVPNTSATAASSGSDLNGMAVKEACLILKARLSAHFKDITQSDAEPQFIDGEIRTSTHQMPFEKLVRSAYMARIQLSASGFYATPGISWDAETGKGRPFYYFAYGAAVSEVEINALTGENKVTRVDILHDVGQSLNSGIDKGQVEGGYIQGMGWLTMEELVFSDKGTLLTHAPSTYKIPCLRDRPDMRISLFENQNTEPTIYRSKAVGEPPLMLAISAHSAIAHAISSFSPPGEWPDLDTPATNEAILMTIRDEITKSRDQGCA